MVGVVAAGTLVVVDGGATVVGGATTSGVVVVVVGAWPGAAPGAPVDTCTAVDGADEPALFTAVTVIEYVPAGSPLISADVVLAATCMPTPPPTGVAVAWYETARVPPTQDGALQPTCTPPLTTDAVTPAGEPAGATARVAGQTAARASTSPLPNWSSRPAVPRSRALASRRASTSSGLLTP